MTQRWQDAIAARVVWLILALALALPLWSLLPSNLVPVLFRALVAVLFIVSCVRPVAAIAALALLGPMALPLVLSGGPPSIGANGALEAMVLAVVAGIAFRWSARGPLPDAGLAWPSFVFMAVVAASAVTLLRAQQLTAGSLPEFLAACFRHATTDYFFQPGRFPAWHEAAVWIEAILLALMIERVVRTTVGSGRTVALMAALGLAGEAVFSWLRLWQVAGRSEDFVNALWRHALSTRITPHLPDPNAIGSLFALGTVCWIALVLEKDRPRLLRLGAGCGALVIGVALWLTGSRAALGATVVAGMWLWWQAHRPSLRTLILITALVAALGNAMLAAGQARASVAAAVGIRVDLALVGVRMAADHPLFGVGLGEFSRQSTGYVSQDLIARFPPASSGENSHNQLVQVLGELGLVGLLVFVWYWSRVLRPAISRLRAGPRDRWLLGWTAGLCAFHASALLGHPFLTPYVVFCVFLVTGVVGGLTPKELKNRRVFLRPLSPTSPRP